MNDRTPLKWKLQPPHLESDNDVVNGPHPLPSDIDENGAPSSDSDEEAQSVIKSLQKQLPDNIARALYDN